MANKLREFRLAKRMTQAELAEKSGVSRATIVALEANTAGNTTSKTLLNIARALGETVDRIFFAETV